MDVRSRHAFLLGAATNWLAFAATLGVSFFLTPYLIGELGKPRYDVWCIVESVLAYFTLLDMGIAACLVRSVARHHASTDRESLNRMASACLAVFLAAGVIALVLGTPILMGMGESLEAKAGSPGDVLPFMLLMLANLAATLPLSIFPNILDGLERFTAKSLVRIGILILRTIGIILAIQTQTGLLPLAVVYTIANLIEHGLMAGLCYRFLPELRFSWRLVDRATFRQVRGYSTDAFLAMLAGRITVQTGAILVGLFLPAGQVTFFATAARLVEYAKTLLRTITATLTPGVSAMEARGDFHGIARLVLTATRWVLYIVLPVNLGLWLFGRPFLHRWVGSEFVDASFPAAAILAATLTLGVAQSVTARVLYGMGRLRLFARMALLESALNLGLTLLLIRPFGVEGVAVAVAVPNVLFCLFVIGFTLLTLGIPLRAYLRRSWLQPLLANTLPLAIWLALGEPAPTWPTIAVGIIAGLVPYGVLVGGMEFRQKILEKARIIGRAVPRRWLAVLRLKHRG
ncbi:MAG: oligosaccharide flippase family protein [Bacteroidales bacterium]|nr:oligosaccharide flippase family protein [Bacteroidales bacterium]